MSVLPEGRKRRAALTTRQKMIIQMLVRMASEPVTVSAISEKLNVSSRTVLREMPVIERWFRDNDFRFVRKPGVGLKIEEDTEQLLLIRELLEMEDVVPSFSRQERRRQLLGELLSAKEPIKSYVFISRYHISEGTLYGDLDALSEWLKDYKITISRRPGVGICLEGSEAAYRQAIANAAFEFLDENKLLSLLCGDADVQNEENFRIQNRLLNFIDPKMIRFVEQALQESEKQLGIKYTDSGYMSLIVHLSLAIRRLQGGEKIEMPARELAQFQMLPEYAVAERISAQIERRFSVNVPKEETGYITMHLTTARIWPRMSGSQDQLQAMNIRQTVMSIAGMVEQMVGLPFRSCSGMIDDLVSHMQTMIHRLSLNLRIENSNTDSVRQTYPEIYAAVENACGILQDSFHLEHIPDAEIGYVAMHFAAAAEKLQTAERKITVVVVCPTGMGTSKMLAANLMRSFHNIEIRKIVSAFRIDSAKLKEEGIDLILSTVTLNTDFPYLCVSPILQAQDKLLLQNEIEVINRRRLRKKTGVRYAPTPDLDSILHVSQIGIEIAEILHHFQIYRLHQVSDLKELIQQAASIFAENCAQQRVIAADMEARERMAETYIPDMSIYLLHCCTTAVSHSRFGYLKLEQPLKNDAGMVLGAVVMIVPDDASAVYAEVISRLSVLLVEEDDFLKALQSGDITAGVALAEKALVKYYQNETTKRIGVDWK